LKIDFTDSRNPKRFKSDGIVPRHSLEAGATDREEKIPGFSIDILQNLTVLMAGAGGLGGEICEGLVRKGIGSLHICDPDSVELSNLSRQKFFKKDLYKNKAYCLARNLVAQAVKPIEIIAYPWSLQELVNKRADEYYNLVIVGVDNNPTRTFASRYFLERAVPVVFTGISKTGNNGYVFVQEKEGPCFSCCFPNSVEDKRMPCPGTPAILDILKVVAGVTLYAVDTMVMERKRCWNYREVFLDGSIDDFCRTISMRNDCQLCGGVRV